MFAVGELVGVNFRFQRAKDGKRPAAQRIAFMTWNGQQIADDFNRNVLGKISNAINRQAVICTCGDIIQQLVNKALHN
jgi:hypothetical protein